MTKDRLYDCVLYTTCVYTRADIVEFYHRYYKFVVIIREGRGGGARICRVQGEIRVKNRNRRRMRYITVVSMWTLLILLCAIYRGKTITGN